MKKKFLFFGLLSLMSNGFAMVGMWDELGNLPEFRYYRQDDLRDFEGLGDDTTKPYLEQEFRELQLEQPGQYAQAPQEICQKQSEQPEKSGTQPPASIQQPVLIAVPGAQVHDVVAAGVVDGALANRLVSPTPEQQVAQTAKVHDIVAAVVTDQPVAYGAQTNRMTARTSSVELVDGKGLKFVIKLGAKPASKRKPKKTVHSKTWVKQLKKEETRTQALLDSSLKKQVMLILEDLKEDGKSTRYSVIQELIIRGADPAVAWELLEDKHMLASYGKDFRENYGRKASYKEKVFKRTLYFAINCGLLDRAKDQDATKTFGLCGKDGCLLPQYVLILTAPGHSKRFKTSRKAVAETIFGLIKECGDVKKHSMNNKLLMDVLSDVTSNNGRYNKLRNILGMGDSPRKKSRKKSQRRKSQEDNEWEPDHVDKEKAQKAKVKVKQEETEEEPDLYCYETFDLDKILGKKE